VYSIAKPKPKHSSLQATNRNRNSEPTTKHMGVDSDKRKQRDKAMMLKIQQPSTGNQPRTGTKPNINRGAAGEGGLTEPEQSTENANHAREEEKELQQANTHENCNQLQLRTQNTIPSNPD